MNEKAPNDSGKSDGPEAYNARAKAAMNKYSLKGKGFVVVDKGRDIGEHSALLVKNGGLKGMGFYHLNHQIHNIHILESLITPMTGDANMNHILESHLRRKKLKTVPLDPLSP